MALSDISNIKLSQDEQARIMSTGLKQSAVYQLLAAQGNVVPTSSLKDKLVHSFTYGDAAFHNPLVDNDPKSVSKLTDNSIEVPMVNEYYIFKVSDFTAEEYPGLIEQLKTELPLVLGQTLDRAVFGTEFIPSSKFKNISNYVATVDNTVDSWQSAAEAPSVDATGWIISNAQKSNVRAAVTAGSTVNPLTFGLNDGFQLAGMPAYFRDLPATGKTVGLVGDFRRAVLYVKDGIEFTVYSPETSFELARENAVAIKASWRIGFAAADQALVKLVTA